MILRKIIKDFIIMLMVVMTITFMMVKNVFAVADYAIKQDYLPELLPNEGVIKFKSSLPDLNPAIAIPSIYEEGNLSIELGNPFCVAYAVLYATAMYAGNPTAKAIATTTLLAGTASIYLTAMFKNRDFEICGADWLVWGNNSNATASELTNINNYYPTLGSFKGSRKYEVVSCTQNVETCLQKCRNREGCALSLMQELLQNPANISKAKDDYNVCLDENPCIIDYDFVTGSGRTYLTINDRVYRERLYDGEEVINEDCLDPREEARLYDVNQGKTPYQLYYMRGSASGNYACDRFLVEKQQEGDQFDQAYKCCIEASNSICIKDKMSAVIETRGERVKFCKKNKRLCVFGEFILEIFRSTTGESGKYCARTWSLCPYNFNIQRGTEKQMRFNKSISGSGSTATVTDECFDTNSNQTLSCQNKIKNFYQYNRHCNFVEPYVPTLDEYVKYSPYIDLSCINFVGSSHNTSGYKSYNGYERMFSKYKSFTAPIAECFSETLKNFLFNRAGHTRCLGDAENPIENPDFSGYCRTGYLYSKGDDLLKAVGLETPTSKLLSYIHNLVMLAVTLMITLYGYNILINSGKLDRKDIMIMLLKVVIVVTFSASSWWYDQLYRFTYGFSNTFSALTSKIGFDTMQDINGNYVKYDGCYFGNINDILNNEDSYNIPSIESNNYFNYPVNRRYVAFFDSLDCKINRYLGFSVGSSVPNIIVALAASFIWPFNIGIYLSVGTLMMALFIINFAVKAVYIFVASAIGIAVLLYAAPLFIPCILFKRTKGMFDKWLKQLLSFTLQPMVLFAFVSMALMIMDKYTLGEGIYSGRGVDRELICGYACVNNNTKQIIKYVDETGISKLSNFRTECGVNNEVIVLKEKSVACFLNKMTTSHWALLQSIGLFIPFLIDIGLSDVIMFLRVAFLFFVLTKVLETIPGVAATLTGGKELPGSKFDTDPFSNARKIANFATTIKRGVKNAGQKFGSWVKSKFDRKDSEGETSGKNEGEGNDEKRNDLSNVNVKKQGE